MNNSETPIRRCDGASRRSFLKAGALAMGAGAGLGLADLLRTREAGRAHAAQKAGSGSPSPGSSAATAKAVILFWLDGGPTHLETYDPKPDAPAEFRGPFGSLPTAVPGVRVGELLPGHARLMDRVSVIRSMHHNNGDHFAAAHWMTTGWKGSNAAKTDPMYPSVGSYIAKLKGSNRPGVPAYASVPVASTVGLSPGYFSSTWLGPAYNPFNAGDSKVRGNLAPTVEAARLSDRIGLLRGMDRMRREIDSSGLMDGVDKFQRQAADMVLSGSARDAFDIAGEPQKVKDLYGAHSYSQYALAARRLVQAGVSFVTVNLNGWDDHSSLEKGMKNKLPPLDRAVSALIEDLTDRGMLDEVMVLVMGEFGRTPRINKGLPQDPVPGRDHWGEAMSVLIAGGGVQGGRIIGSTDGRGERPVDRPTTPEDLLATVYHAVGIDPRQTFPTPSGRPIGILDRGDPIRELF
jgi:hypothetical protein